MWKRGLCEFFSLFSFCISLKIRIFALQLLTNKETFVYLVDALNFTEAESRIIEEVKPYAHGNLDVTDIKRVKYAEIFTSDSDVADRWYKVRCLFITIDEKTQTEKEIANNMLVQASTFHEAVENFDKGMKGSLMDYRIASLQETKIMDVFRFVARDKKEDAKPEFEA